MSNGDASTADTASNSTTNNKDDDNASDGEARERKKKKKKKPLFCSFARQLIWTDFSAFFVVNDDFFVSPRVLQNARARFLLFFFFFFFFFFFL
jgi:hypothetical protein